jgi:hypothetical protein
MAKLSRGQPMEGYSRVHTNGELHNTAHGGQRLRNTRSTKGRLERELNRLTHHSVGGAHSESISWMVAMDAMIVDKQRKQSWRFGLFSSILYEERGEPGEPKNRTEPNRTEPNRTEPNRTEPNRTEPNRTEPNRTEPNRTEPNLCQEIDFYNIIASLLI